MSTDSRKTDGGKSYHTECTGDALVTVKAHEKEEDITLFGVRVWVAFEILGIPYKVDEVDPYKKPKELLEVSPKGLVPGLRFNRYNPPRSLNESTVILDFLEDLAVMNDKTRYFTSHTNPYARGLARLQADHINRTQTEEKQIEAGKEFHASIEGLVALLERAEREILGPAGGSGASGEGELKLLRKGLGVWVPGTMSWDGQTVKFLGLYRAKVVLGRYRGFKLPQGERFNAWLSRLFAHPAFKATCSTDQLYLDSYERYAFNRPNTSQVANAINEGRSLP
ncbi:hypothetical protein CPB84DRAFT_1811706 [Gymnopilus junonius]|uniref:GST N-terminal domain-containing protein n=1 Tax=Gymnopilus junonius TaxID=109634 RepID=A0A9P5P4W9_GYMJU|nr:hypothetical protein CPB84DRAFT_1811706 [Gymnopilus junonius]